MTAPSESIARLRAIKEEYVDDSLKWYEDHSTWPRVVFRASGVLVIVSSLTIPFLAAWEGEWRSIGVPVASLTVAIATSLNAFFSWQRTWEKRINMQLTLEGLIASWETEMTAAEAAPDANAGFERALRATQNLIDQTRALSVGETAKFFATMQWPDVKKSSN